MPSIASNSDPQSVRTRVVRDLARKGYAGLRAAGNCAALICALAIALAMPRISAAQTVTVVEYYHKVLDAYFITGRAAEQSLLDGAADFQRTGMTFQATNAVNAGQTQTRICRFYISTSSPFASTHFYGREDTDCELVLGLNLPGFNWEGYDFAVTPTTGGACPVGSTAIYRGFRAASGGKTPNHRYSASVSDYNAAITAGYSGEGIAFCASGATPASAASKKNILLIIADDLGLDSSNQYNNSLDKPRTPNLDALAASGIVFENLWSTPACTTTRGTIITGQHGVHSGITFVPAAMSANANTIQRYLRSSAASASYETAVIGKWHLGGTNPSNSHPTDSGVGYYTGNLSGTLPDYYSWPMVQDGVSTTSSTYHTTKITDLARDWIAKQGQPWFLWLAYSAPHDPFHLPPTTLQSRTTLTGSSTDVSARPREYYLAAIEAMDAEIGRLLGSMSAQTRANTVVIFIGDNGSPTQTVDTNVFDRNKAKATLYEGGIRVPMIVSGNGVTRVNARETALINTVDFYPTIAELAGNSVTKLNDGYSFAPLLKAGGAAARQYNYSEFQSDRVNGWTVRNAQYKLITNLDGTQALYDLTTDLKEQTNLLTNGADYSTIVNTLKTAGENIRK
jgi:arylsulfatase A-like enzyme